MSVNSTDKTNEEIDMGADNFVSHTSPSTGLLSVTAGAPSESAPTSECPDIEMAQEMPKLPEKSVNSNDHIMKSRFCRPCIEFRYHSQFIYAGS